MAHMKDHEAWLADLRRYGNSPRGFINYRAAELFANAVEVLTQTPPTEDFNIACDRSWDRVIKAVETETLPRITVDREKVKDILTIHWSLNEEFLEWVS